MPLSRHSRDLLLDQLFAGKVYVSAHTAATDGEGYHEATGRGYQRRSLEGGFAAAIRGAKSTTKGVEFLDLPQCSIVEIGFWDAEQGGNFLWSAALPLPKNFEAGDVMRLEAGKIVLALR